MDEYLADDVGIFDAGEACDKVQGLEDHMGGAITPGVLEGVAHLSMLSQRQAFFGHGRPGNVATQALEFVALVCLGRDWRGFPLAALPGGNRHTTGNSV